MDKLRAMQVFTQIADAGSLSAAARQLGQSLPAVVRTLAALEAELGVRLFNRTTRRISLTDEGRVYLQSCRSVLAAVHDAEAALTTDAHDPAGLLTITAPVLFGQLHVAPELTALLRQHARLRCRMLLLDRVVNLLEEGVDLGVRIGVLDDSSLVARPVGRVRRMVVASPDWLAEHGAPQHPRELDAAQCIGQVGGGATWWRFAEQGRPYTVAAGARLEFNHIAPAIDACVAGLGLGTFLSYQIADHLSTGRLRAVLPEFEPEPRPVNLIYPHARLLPARVRVALDWLEQQLRQRLSSVPG
jgi:DNA-binding transcriptional LysR family regulator